MRFAPKPSNHIRGCLFNYVDVPFPPDSQDPEAPTRAFQKATHYIATVGSNEELTPDFTCEHRPQLPHLRRMKERLGLIDQYDVPSGHNSFEKNSRETLHAVALLMKKWVTTYRSNICIPNAIHQARVLRKLTYVYRQLATSPVVEHDIFPKRESDPISLDTELA